MYKKRVETTYKIIQPNATFTNDNMQRIFNLLKKNNGVYNLSTYHDKLDVAHGSMSYFMEKLRQSGAIEIKDNATVSVYHKRKTAHAVSCMNNESNIVTAPDKMAQPLEAIVMEFNRLYEIEEKYNRMVEVLRGTVE